MRYKAIFTHFLVPILFLLLGIFMFYKNLFNNGFGFFNLLTPGNSSDLISNRTSELLAGDKVFGKFTANYPNIGIVSVRFNNRNRDSDDELVFRLKEKGSNHWYYEAKYKTDQFLPNQLFPFGFPAINDSVGKNYLFELESIRGSTGSGIFLDRTSPNFAVVSFFNQSEILSSKKETIKFVTQKILNIVKDKENLTSTILYFLPLIVYLVYLITLDSSYHFLLFSTLIPIFCDIFFLQKSSDFLLFSTMFLWSLTIYRFKFEYRISAYMASCFLFLTIVMTILGNPLFSEKTGVWAFLFLCVAVVQQVQRYIYGPQKRFSLNQFLKTVNSIKINKNNTSLKIFLDILVITISYLVVKKFWFSLIGLHNGYLLFEKFYPNVKNMPIVFWYLLCSFLLATIFVTLGFHFRQKFWNNKILILIYLLVFQILANVIVSKFTEFRYQTKILSLTPSVTSEAWVDVSINGVNFQDLPFVGKVFVAGVEQVENVILWSDTKIVFRTNPTISTSGDVCIQTLSKGNSNCLPFKYYFGKK